MRFNIDHVEESFKGQCVHVAISNVGFLHHYRHWKNSIYDKLAVDELTKHYQRSSAKKIIDEILFVLQCIQNATQLMQLLMFQQAGFL